MKELEDGSITCVEKLECNDGFTELAEVLQPNPIYRASRTEYSRLEYFRTLRKFNS